MYRARWQAAFLILVGCFGVAACALAPSTNPTVAPERLAELRRICTQTMQLAEGNVQFNGCVEVLSDTDQMLRRVKQ